MYLQKERAHYLVLIPHGAFSQYRDLGSGVLLQAFNGAALRPQNLPHKVELRGNMGKSLNTTSPTKSYIILLKSRLTRGYCLTGMSTLSFTRTLLEANKSRYSSESFLGSPFWTLSISAKQNPHRISAW